MSLDGIIVMEIKINIIKEQAEEIAIEEIENNSKVHKHAEYLFSEALKWNTQPRMVTGHRKG